MQKNQLKTQILIKIKLLKINGYKNTFHKCSFSELKLINLFLTPRYFTVTLHIILGNHSG